MNINRKEYHIKIKPIYPYYLLFTILSLTCFLIFTISIVIFFTGQYISKFDPIIMIFIGMIYSIIITINIISIIQTKRYKKLHDSFKNLSDLFEIIKKHDNIKIQSDTVVSIEELFTYMKNLIVGLNKNNEQLQSSKNQLEDKLENREQLQIVHHEFIANASHELKTPLGLLMLYAEGLKNNIENTDKDYYCDVILEVVESLNNKVQRLMSSSFAEGGLYPMRMESFDYTELFCCIIDHFEIMLSDYNTQVEYDDDIYIYGDIYYLGEVIKNFITNAVSYTDKGNKIHIKLKKTDKHAVLSVYNEGIHINPECIPSIWDSFYKVNNKCCCDNAENHIGMGLYIVRLVMEQHHGIYGVDNISDGVQFYTKLALI